MRSHDREQGGADMAQAALDVLGTERVGDGDGRRGLRTDVREQTSWQRAHEELVRLAKKRAGLDFEEGRWLLAAFRSGTHVRLGYGSFLEYTQRLFGYGP